ncbi:uncharacterized protein NDAI_0D03150 [Naumovozyma dairenensis CBS 421]|uniref:Piwi domain-containing protein n=1 Tax=Naumovozyma dairenensis (strain ATCC 10597 / BCRC 20456 / CBS 421 / NBRC 0211 / NRRL Y-12639) TaxID=1071378 RepID=G0WA18_NAUDC|nr:hypothetical protein NDAI_0D03150 [Naumovozyma dairenensis CBS 421]CCD24629.1 hypothetical protein NDAI_0D03150 [Naumovozyma dairenensis CBS 421]
MVDNSLIGNLESLTIRNSDSVSPTGLSQETSRPTTRNESSYRLHENESESKKNTVRGKKKKKNKSKESSDDASKNGTIRRKSPKKKDKEVAVENKKFISLNETSSGDGEEIACETKKKKSLIADTTLRSNIQEKENVDLIGQSGGLSDDFKNFNIPDKAFDLVHLQKGQNKVEEPLGEYKVKGRQDYGKKGTTVDILTNHVLLALGKDTEESDNKTNLDPWWRDAMIFSYHVDFKASQPKYPTQKPSTGSFQTKKYEILESLFEEDETLFKYKDRIAFNGEDTLYSHVRLEEFTLFEGCWAVSNKKKKHAYIPHLPHKSNPPEDDLPSKVTLKSNATIPLKDIYDGTISRNTQEQESKMAGTEKHVLLALMGAKFLQMTDPVFQVNGNKFFIFNEHTKAKPFQLGGYLMHGFTVSLRYAFGSVLLNAINVTLPFIKHSKYLPGDPRFQDNHKAPYTLMDWLIECYQQTDPNNVAKRPAFNGKVTSNDLNLFISKNTELQNLTKGLKVYCNHIQYDVDSYGQKKPSAKMKPKQIKGFSIESARVYKFKVKPSDLDNNIAKTNYERDISITTETYFLKKYKMVLKYPDMKMAYLDKGGYVPLECLTIVPGQKLKGKVYDENTVIEFAALRPTDKFKMISALALPLITKALKPEEETKQPPCDSYYQFLRIPSRIIDAPAIKFQNSQICYTDKPFNASVVDKTIPNQETKGNWNLQGHRFISTPKDLITLRVFFITESSPPSKTGQEIFLTVKKFIVDVAEHGMKFRAEKPVLIQNFHAPRQEPDANSMTRGHGMRGKGGRFNRSRPSAYKISDGENKLCEELSNAKENSYFLFILACGDDSLTYNRLKYLADLKYGVINSCLVWDKFKKKSAQYNVNACMKMNLKLQGINHCLEEKDLNLLKDSNGLPFMVLGADVTHYPEKDQNSIASLVASFDNHFAQFPGNYLLQSSPGEEMISGIGNLIGDRLKLYKKYNNGKLPSKILFYRDGVSESQFSQVVQIEVRALKESLRRIGSNLRGSPYNPAITTVAVVKRNQVRFMPLFKNGINEQGETCAVQSMDNVMPGTVVDRGITSTAHFDFFLQSQQSLKGTGVPGHYWCIYDENEFTSDLLQYITHCFCYLFGRSSTSIKVASPIYYADLLCERAAQLFKANFAIVKNEYEKNSRHKTPILPANNLLPPVNENIKDIMYYI